MPNHITTAMYRRTSVNWNDSRGDIDHLGEDWLRVAEAARWWDEVFRRDYFSFRAGLSEIAAQNWMGLQDLDIMFSCRTPQLAWVLDDLTSQAILIPTDDDDWFSPQLARALRDAYDPKVDIYYWDDAIYTYNYGIGARGEDTPRFLAKRGPGERVEPQRMIRTNNYAVSSAFLVGQKRELREPILKYHVLVDELVAKARVKKIDQVLSVTNKSIASITQIHKVGSAAELRCSVESYVRSRREVDERVGAWAVPLLDATDRLYRSLLE